MQTALEGVAIVGGTVLLALVGVAIVRRSVSSARLARHNAETGAIVAIAGVAYAVVLGLTVVAVWGRFETARRYADDEANALSDLLRASEAFPTAAAAEARAALLAYGHTVIDEEWEAMARSEAPSADAEARVEELWRHYRMVGEGPARESAFFAPSLDRLKDLGQARHGRVLASHRGLPAAMWSVLALGSALTIGFALCIGIEDGRLQAALIGLLAAAVALLLFLSYALDNPFRGDVRVRPEALELVLAPYERAGDSVPLVTPTGG